jgi:hypothetical protein
MSTCGIIIANDTYVSGEDIGHCTVDSMGTVNPTVTYEMKAMLSLAIWMIVMSTATATATTSLPLRLLLIQQVSFRPLHCEL